MRKLFVICMENGNTNYKAESVRKYWREKKVSTVMLEKNWGRQY